MQGLLSKNDTVENRCLKLFFNAEIIKRDVLQQKTEEFFQLRPEMELTDFRDLICPIKTTKKVVGDGYILDFTGHVTERQMAQFHLAFTQFVLYGNEPV